jgi:hypothetical protein
VSWRYEHQAGHRKTQLFPNLELSIELTRGEIRLAAELALAELSGRRIPACAWGRAFHNLKAMAEE